MNKEDLKNTKFTMTEDQCPEINKHLKRLGFTPCSSNKEYHYIGSKFRYSYGNNWKYFKDRSYTEILANDILKIPIPKMMKRFECEFESCKICKELGIIANISLPEECPVRNKTFYSNTEIHKDCPLQTVGEEIDKDSEQFKAIREKIIEIDNQTMIIKQ